MIEKAPTFTATHEEILPLLPWYANGSLKAAEHRAVAQHLRSCDACRKELADCQRVQLRWQYAPVQAATEDSFARLMARIDALGTPEPASATLAASTRVDPGVASPDAGWRRRVADWRHGLRWLPNTRLTLVSAFGAVLLAVVGARAWVSAEASGYRTLGLPAAEGGIEPGYVRVVFAPDASIGQVVALIESLDARIVDGPTQPGAFTVRPSRTQRHEAAVQGLATRLRADSAVVFAEPASGPARQD